MFEDLAEDDHNENSEILKLKEETDSNANESDDSEEDNEMEESDRNEFNEEMKQELEDNVERTDADIKVKKEETNNDKVENITDFQDDEEHGWQEENEEEDEEKEENEEKAEDEEEDGEEDEEVDDQDITDEARNNTDRSEISVKPDISEDISAFKSRSNPDQTPMDIASAFDSATPVNCETCILEGKPTKIYKSRSYLQIHFTNWHEFGTYLCDTCGESFKLRGQLRNHNSAKHSQKSQSKGGACPQCGKVVKNVPGHITEVHGPKREYVCPVCARILNTFKQMRDHVRSNHNNEGKVFICHICSKELGNELNLKQHLRRQHYQTPAPEDYVTCNECGKQFSTEYRLKSHRKAVHESDPTNCEICGGNYKNNYSLSKHMKNAHDGHPTRPKVGKGSYRMPNTPALNPSNYSTLNGRR